jgi:Domain of unknown function (DUF4160)
MATLLPNANITSHQVKGYRIFIFSHDHPHPPHVHFGRKKRFSSWDIQELICTDRDGFSKSELAVQRELLLQYLNEVLQSWQEHWQRQNPHPPR